jgi:hypothetical protein
MDSYRHTRADVTGLVSGIIGDGDTNQFNINLSSMIDLLTALRSLSCISNPNEQYRTISSLMVSVRQQEYDFYLKFSSLIPL